MTVTFSWSCLLTSLSPAPAGWWSRRSCSCSPHVCVSLCPARERCGGGTSQRAAADPASSGTCPCASPADAPADTTTDTEKRLCYDVIWHFSCNKEWRIFTLKLLPSQIYLTYFCNVTDLKEKLFNYISQQFWTFIFNFPIIKVTVILYILCNIFLELITNSLLFLFVLQIKGP